MENESQNDWIDAGAEADFEPGAARKVDAAGTPIAVFCDPAGGYAALTDRCPHAGAPLSSGVLRDGQVVCCWHGWSFEPGTGKCTTVSWSRPVGVHDVKVADGRVYVRPTSEPAEEPADEPGPSGEPG